jgi:radical SAM protein with 4Fe4S-binding SPASM domain
VKTVSLPDYNMLFNEKDGTLFRWGKTHDDDPVMCPIGPEILDIEISTICNGVGVTKEKAKPCSWCYKSNTGCGKNMSLETFKKVLKVFPNNLTQIAFGIGDIDANPDLIPIFKHCRDNDIVPNITVNGMGIDTEWAKRLADNCGAVAVSHYGLDDICFNTVEKLKDAGLQQVNIHKLLSEQTYDDCASLIEKAATDNRLKGLRAIVFLALKPKGSRNKLTMLVNESRYFTLLKRARELGVGVGMDSCSAPSALKAFPEAAQYIEPCESGLFSFYVNVEGKAFPCSFSEGVGEWSEGVDLTADNISIKDVWYHPLIEKWRSSLLEGSNSCSSCSSQKQCRPCPIYKVVACQPEKNGLLQIRKGK